MHNYKYLFFYVVFCFSCTTPTEKKSLEFPIEKNILEGTNLVVLGTVQDAGSPHIGCQKPCCKALFDTPDISRKVVSLGLIDQSSKQHFVLEASPDFSTQLRDFSHFHGNEKQEMPDGVLLTHAHIGHYTGLMYLGREAKATKDIPVYAMPKMRTFLKENGPWSQLVKLGNIQLKALENKQEQILSPSLKVIPFRVPHRDEYSETVGYEIIGPNKKALFIPDIDKWGKWELAIEDLIKEVDYALVDGTFYDSKEMPHRDIAEIPHPFIIESMERFKHLPKAEKDKIYFIHFNHTNPVLNTNSDAYQTVLKNGFHIAQFGEVLPL